MTEHTDLWLLCRLWVREKNVYPVLFLEEIRSNNTLQSNHFIFKNHSLFRGMLLFVSIAEVTLMRNVYFQNHIVSPIILYSYIVIYDSQNSKNNSFVGSVWWYAVAWCIRKPSQVWVRVISISRTCLKISLYLLEILAFHKSLHMDILAFQHLRGQPQFVQYIPLRHHNVFR